MTNKFRTGKWKTTWFGWTMDFLNSGELGKTAIEPQDMELEDGLQMGNWQFYFEVPWWFPDACECLVKVVILRAEMEDHTKSRIKLTQRQPGKRSKLTKASQCELFGGQQMPKFSQVQMPKFICSQNASDFNDVFLARFPGSYSIFESEFATKCFSETMSGMDGIQGSETLVFDRVAWVSTGIGKTIGVFKMLLLG